ncbi:hypothetical protein DCAR_0933837 [Daucus carota subsp. sativus]|uniref:F-box domain-containing protein n=1 Tax=Daucus carota subsp. sativus TaxID=79200 RepID=A0AAF1BDT6_DAUCS|nr:PREDICTED: F-box/kelch-repeat protein At3g23880-like [Daucus carota subsp. sativus]WOH14318.1 hypothetical protein DCAR_0933837 [Daucus carota subsp. sativus]
MATDEEENKNPNPSLPEDLIHDILSRLSVQTLLQFRSVCKSWLSLISSSSFIRTHLLKSTNDPLYTHHGLVLCEWNWCNCFGIYMDPRTCSLNTFFNRPFTYKSWRIVEDNKLIDKFSIYNQGVIQVRNVVGYCNGLVCLACNMKVYDIYFWNPATRKVRKLPNLEPRKFEKEDIQWCRCGFCYDELNDTFKVYSVCRSYDFEYEVSVYSSKSDCWRVMGDFPCSNDKAYYVSKSPAIFANGLLHWVIVGESYEDERIISLDIKTETYREILLPKFREEEGEYIIKFGNFSNSLSLICDFDDYADLWILKGCGGEEFWTKLLTISYMDTLEYYWRLKPICFSVNGEILLLHNNKTILLYNTKDKTFDELLDLDFVGLPRWPEADVYTYVESLVSP